MPPGFKQAVAAHQQTPNTPLSRQVWKKSGGDAGTVYALCPSKATAASAERSFLGKAVGMYEWSMSGATSSAMTGRSWGMRKRMWHYESGGFARGY
jgi:hypothetical protein